MYTQSVPAFVPEQDRDHLALLEGKHTFRMSHQDTHLLGNLFI